MMMASWYEQTTLATPSRQWLGRIGHSNDLIARSHCAIDRSHAATRSSYARASSLPSETERAIPPGAVRAFLAGMNADALYAIVEDRSAVDRDAAATRNDATTHILREAFVIPGRHLADELGPKAAGSPLN